ncbi:MAG: hypothetical protein QOC55_1875, partial [Thermoleophilaceae bacterium]|nr:hypothetical protein [Thermoleophilaceae bacterium]
MKNRRAARAALAVTLALGSLCAGSDAGASVFVGHSGWFWANPLPQGNTLRAIDFAGTRGYAVGDFGTVMRSDDGGASWSGLTTGTTAGLRVVRAVSRDVFVVAGKCIVRRSDDGGASFRTLPWSPAGSSCRRQVESVAFPSAQSGYLLLSDGSLLHTRDGGQSWTARTAIPGTAATGAGSAMHPSDVFFTSADAGFVTTGSGIVYRTTDGATSWSPVAQAPQHLDSIFFADAQTGFAAGGASILRTTDGGATWSQQGVVTPPASVDWIRCGTPLTCMAATAGGDRLLRTDDGGDTWTAISPATRPLYAAAYAESGAVAAVGQAGTTVWSQDAGHNFVRVSDDLDTRFTLLHAVSPDTAYVAGRGGTMARTTDGGRTWSTLAPPVADRILDLSFPTVSTGFALAPDDVLMRTDDGGAS